MYINTKVWFSHLIILLVPVTACVIISNSECSIKNSLEANCRIYSVQSQEHRHHWHHYQSKEIYKFKKRSMIIQFALILIEEETHQSMSELLTWPHFLCSNLFNNNYCFSSYSSRPTYVQTKGKKIPKLKILQVFIKGCIGNDMKWKNLSENWYWSNTQRSTICCQIFSIPVNYSEQYMVTYLISRLLKFSR